MRTDETPHLRVDLRCGGSGEEKQNPGVPIGVYSDISPADWSKWCMDVKAEERLLILV